MDEVHHVDALQMTARHSEGRLAYHIGMMEQMQQHELGHSIKGGEEKTSADGNRIADKKLVLMLFLHLATVILQNRVPIKKMKEIAATM